MSRNRCATRTPSTAFRAALWSNSLNFWNSDIFLSGYDHSRDGVGSLPNVFADYLALRGLLGIVSMSGAGKIT
jgi:hypothetical protein